MDNAAILARILTEDSCPVEEKESELTPFLPPGIDFPFKFASAARGAYSLLSRGSAAGSVGGFADDGA